MNDGSHHPERRPPGRQHCVTCKAPRREGAICHRCGTDLSPLLALEHRADSLRAGARRCYALGWYRRAAALFREITRIEACSEDLVLLVCASLRCGDFRTVCHAHGRLRSLQGE